MQVQGPIISGNGDDIITEGEICQEGIFKLLPNDRSWACPGHCFLLITTLEAEQ